MTYTKNLTMNFTRLFTWGPLMVVLALILFISPAKADSTSKSACSNQFDQCLDNCDIDFADEPARRAACVPVCSGKFAACDAGVAYEQAKPWLEDQAKKTKDFFENLIDQLESKETKEAPQTKTKDNSI